jgi:hypothetical protein
MNPVLKNALAVLGGIIIGIFINASILSLGEFIVGAPDGVDLSDPNNVANNIHLFKFKHFAMPWLAHAMGTLVGAFTAVKLAANYHFNYAMVVGAFFFTGGSIMAYMIQGAPLWVNITDLVFAYFPMAWIGAKLANKK